ncbi:helix-turn-helix domain-containing protein [Streptomyces sp. DSM 44917]|uniref:Helix-turn-helix domain-containing protein n=1 Tax=Streptomyces boetiae TaxID=3075541 RepID=A0ABU2L2X1_9ACTN|nr:helix-turn-helix domain-containing protein [Streptomyces sp. DSM 44917]MDT0305915.1 helix-turn-helix domain-containing protein [Streptomyces sp. DSM 44917]
MAGRRTDTRERIRAVAMALFSELGYEKTSIREIAERLGITKAAVYYHFRAKEDIVVSLADDLRSGVDELLAWSAAQPPGRETGRELLRRYGALLHATGRDMTRFMYENQAAFRALEVGAGLRYQFREVADAMTAPDHAPLARYHARQALAAISWSVGMMGDLDLSDEQCREAAVAIALGIYDRGPDPG